MTVMRLSGALIASLAIVGAAGAQKGGGKPKGGTLTPYTPVIVNVTCDGTGTKLLDALNVLNPLTNVYEVRVSGICPESLTIENFQNLTITSAMADANPTIGAVAIAQNANVVKLSRLVLNNKTTLESVDAKNAHLVLNDLDIFCETASCGGVTKKFGVASLYKVAFHNSNCGQPCSQITASDSDLLLVPSAKDEYDSGLCLKIGTVVVSNGTALLKQGVNCVELIDIALTDHAVVLLYAGTSPVSASVGDLSILTGSYDLREYQCGFFSLIEENGGGNLCP